MTALREDAKQLNEKFTVLLLDPNADFAKLVQGWFSTERDGVGFTLSPVDSVSEAVKSLAKGGIDVILADLSVAGGGPLNTFLQIQQEARATPIIVLSSAENSHQQSTQSGTARTITL